jgi:hypothetical protein
MSSYSITLNTGMKLNQLSEMHSGMGAPDNPDDTLTRSELMMIIQMLKANGGHQVKIRKLGILMKSLPRS